MKIDFKNYTKRYPDSKGYFGTYGGSFLDEKLQRAMDEVTEAYETIAHSAQFINELRRIRKEFQEKPTPIYHCERLSRELGTTQIYLKREDLNHTGAHKLNHCMEESLLTKYMGKSYVQRLLEHETCLRHGAFERIDQQDATVRHIQYAFYLSAEVGVSRRMC